MKAILVRTFAECVRIFVMRVPLNVSNMRRWGWLIAAFVQRLAGFVLLPVKVWLRPFKKGVKKTRRFQNEPACQITLHQQTKNQIKLIRKKSLVKFFLL
ncbi:hypothetical protein [Dyadobacter sp. BHUBP1]|uniref:hypothetical protein n=1 Tax=Dyadobacter sp. BHUBP1 TaxID=3424178 RepID=UPI003D33AA06